MPGPKLHGGSGGGPQVATTPVFGKPKIGELKPGKLPPVVPPLEPLPEPLPPPLTIGGSDAMN